MAMRARHKIRVPHRGTKKTDDFDSAWSVLSAALTAINGRNASDLSFEQLYRNAYNIVLSTRGDDLYENVKQLQKDWLINNVQKRIIGSIQPSIVSIKGYTDLEGQLNDLRLAGDKFLAVLKNAWENHQVSMGMTTDVLMYMDRIIATEKSKPQVYSLSMMLFRDYALNASVSRSATVASVLESTILFMIQLERNGHIIERHLIRHCMRMLEELNADSNAQENASMYVAYFEPAFLAASTDFYQSEGRRLLALGDATKFCKIASDRIAEEQERCRLMLARETELKILDVLDEQLLLKNIEQVVNIPDTGVRNMLDRNLLDELKAVYRLSARVDKKKEALVKVLNERIVELGDEINAVSLLPPAKADKKTEKDGKEKAVAVPATVSAIQWVDSILALKKQFDIVWKTSFDSDQGIETSMMSSFSQLINANTRASEFLSLFFDDHHKKLAKGMTESDADTLLENGIAILRYITDKDLFETYYKKHLARRLLTKRTSSMDGERNVISKMKAELGTQFTQRIEAMFKDMAISTDLTNNYRDHVARSADPDHKPVALEVSILTSTMWPLEVLTNPDKKSEVQSNQSIFPRELDYLKLSFEKFYLDQHNGRKLSWQAAMGTVDIRATFNRKNGKVQRYDLNVSTYSAFILVLFNSVPDGESLTLEEIEGRTSIPHDNLVRNLLSLSVAPKTRVLIKEPMSKTVLPTDRFFFNHEFTSPTVKIRINVVSGGVNKVEDKDRRGETEKKVNVERVALIDAAVVRTMKQRRSLPHSTLVSEVVASLARRFVPDVRLIKKCIESLIDRDYLERLSEDPPTYGYIA
ncbi:hypothetical protein N7495_001534 [Penicillium taxi]|uniref:uncharacterized protein n=1 Tax=Penicillium taxi TaxID=168475 RepID=UPI002545BB55|nr:uncharacterized protein N7495_001534 [Penicillium taxi]KAJ5908852.1 hypothetical protein N7495_001534 [Penicillium taxi]